MCTVLLPAGDYPIAVNKYIIYQMLCGTWPLSPCLTVSGPRLQTHSAAQDAPAVPFGKS